MARKKVTVTRRGRGSSGGVPAKNASGFRYIVQEGQTEEQYRKLLEVTNKLFSAAEESYVKFNTQRLVMMWDVGEKWKGFFAAGKNARGQITEQSINAVAQDLAPFSTGQRVTKEVMRMCLRVTEAYPKARIETLAKKGINENHISVFLQLDDKGARGKLEDRAVEEGLNGNQCRQVVKEMAKDPAQAKYLSPTTRSRFKQEVTKKKSQQDARVNKPARMIEYALGKMETEADNLADLLMALDNVGKLGFEDQKALVKPLDELISRLGDMNKTYGALKDAGFAALIVCKQAAPPPPPKTKATKGAQAAVAADKAATKKKAKSKKKASKKASSKKK